MLYHGPVRVAADAAVGPAIVRCELSPNSKFKSSPTDIAVEIIKSSPSDNAVITR